MAASDHTTSHHVADRAIDARPGALLVWHGYLLGGTGSNIYTREIVRAWVEEGRGVVLMCQEPDPGVLDCIDEVQWVDGRRIVRGEHVHDGGIEARRQQGAGWCLQVRTDLDGVLPVYVLDRYAGWEAVRFVDMDGDAFERWAACTREAVAGVLERHAIAGALLNHAVMGPPVLREVFEAAGVQFAVKVHGSELEYAIAEAPVRFARPALEGLRGAMSILVGSQHIADRTIELLAPAMEVGEAARLRERMLEIPPGVDLARFRPVRDAASAQRALVDELDAAARGSRGRDQHAATALAAVLDGELHPELAHRIHELHGSYQERDSDPGAADAVATLLADDAPVITFVGKLIRQKGPHLVLAALPLVRAQVPDVRLIMAGFGPMREGLEAMLTALDRGDLALLRELAAHGAALDGGSDEPLPHILRFLDDLESSGEVDGYVVAARGMRDAVAWTGLVDHAVLSALWPACRASVVPSILSEAFGMVAAEAAACGCLPVVSLHSGLAAVAGEIAGRYGSAHASLTGFDVHGATPVHELAARLTTICRLAPADHDLLAAAARRTVEEEWGWHAIADRVADACSAG